MANLGRAALVVEAPERRVIVERGALDAIEEIDIARAQIDALDGCPRVGNPAGVIGAGQAVRRIGVPAGDEPDGVARVRRAEDGQDQIRTGADAPGAESLAEIGIVECYACSACRIEETADAEDGVEPNAGEGVAGELALALDRIVEQDDGRAQVGEEVMDRVAHAQGQRVAIGLCGRLDDILVERQIDRENAPVDRFQGIVDRIGIVWLSRLLPGGAGGERQAHRDGNHPEGGADKIRAHRFCSHFYQLAAARSTFQDHFPRRRVGDHHNRLVPRRQAAINLSR